jgi:hypothetical protein
MKTMKLLGVSLLLAALVSSVALAYSIDWYSINSGGGISTSASYGVNATIGQPVAGFASNTSFLHWIGFWAGDVPTPTVAESIEVAKQMPDGTYVSLAGRLATTGPSDFTNFFYVEERGRYSGIRVAAPPSAVSGLARGAVVNVIGTMDTTDAGERQLIGPIVIVVYSDTPLGPLGMTNKSLGGANVPAGPAVKNGKGLNNVGLLVTTWGYVSAIAGSDMLITDGSGDNVRVNVAGLASLPGEGDYVTVIGISSVVTSGGDTLPYVLPRTRSDILSY